MIRLLADKSKFSYSWIDITAPEKSELQQIAQEYGMLEQSVQDSLQADHLPKYERLKDYTFSILRLYASDDDLEADTVQELTDKIAVFIGEKFIITIHRKEWPMLDKVNEEHVQTGDCTMPLHIYIEIVRAGLQSFEEPA